MPYLLLRDAPSRPQSAAALGMLLILCMLLRASVVSRAQSHQDHGLVSANGPEVVCGALHDHAGVAHRDAVR